MKKPEMFFHLFAQTCLALMVASRQINDSRLVLPRKFDCCWTPLVVSPECGVDGRTYINTCTRACEGVGPMRKGYCEFDPSKCLCSKVYRPECGMDEVTYDNSCLRECFGVALNYRGKCVENPDNHKECCSSQHGVDNEVQCGVDGFIYMSICERECKGVEEADDYDTCDGGDSGYNYY